ncbi:hypothetical protein ETU08_05260 [Apibacter muscae]|uniref:Lipocalin-like domain-containing protein n=1 Tax=Apibacter muscae TaxID=2509004 RepID=A0A563DFD3_9FLAO|nr:lipocalin family protein [Apibacter muscae]TWP24468.1 hypothetical protein ETU10_04290 [Apibacter muscae]TWP28779.1 hypothetical protein ETU09_05545 [Apibacter muscae]TWP29969.1 hypothetical protein ETU08_05260 [Apibacter muscae]
MKKFILLGVLSMLFFYSCSTSNNDAVNRSSQRIVRGTWNLDKVTYSENMVKVKAFDEFDAQCLTNSTWYFVSNNYTGNFTLQGGNNCPSGVQSFSWYINNQDALVLKLLNDGDKARKVTTGTIYQFQSSSENEFTLNQVINGVKISYHFTRLSTGKL